MNTKRILIVDDEPHAVRVVKLALERAGFTVDSASNGLQALEYLQSNQPDVVITDIDMPRMDGKELTDQIATRFPDRRFHIIILTARAELEHRAWSAGFTDLTFMEKPVSIRKLITSLESLKSGHRPTGLPA